MPKLQFWYDFGSTYSYLSAMRIEALAVNRGIEVDWRPFLLGPIFRAAGFASSPFLEQPAKLDYMWRDVSRLAARRGLTFRKPDIFPANGVYASRIALIARDEGWVGDWSRRVFEAVFVDGRDISNTEVLGVLCSELGRDATGYRVAAQDQAIKDQLRAESETAATRGVFGAPTFFTDDGEMFWGDDRLESALSWSGRNQSDLPGGFM